MIVVETLFSTVCGTCMVELLLLLLFVDGNGGGGGGICLTSALLLNIGNAGGGTNRCFRLLFLLYNIMILNFYLDILFCRSYFI